MFIKPHITAWEHQKMMLQFCINHPQAALFAGMATGKTLTQLLYMSYLADQHKARRFLVLCPVAVMDVWRREVEKFCIDLKVLVLNKGTSKTKAAQLLKFDEGLVVVNYETAKLLPLERIAFDLVIADESHKLKSHNSQMSKMLAVRCRNIPRKVIMTGTMYDDRPVDVFGQVRFLFPDYRPTRNGIMGIDPTVHSLKLGTWTSFFETYADYENRDNIKLVKNYKNLDQLQAILNEFTMIVDSEKVAKLPPFMHSTRWVELTPKTSRLYREMKNNYITRLEGRKMTADNVLVLALRLHQLTGGFFKPDDYDSPPVMVEGEHGKLEALLELIDEADGAPFVVFTRFRTDVAKIAVALDKLGITYNRLTGEVNEWVEWQEGRGGQVMLANIQAGNAGVDLSRARYCAFYSIGYSRTQYRQALYRVRRPTSDQSKPVMYYHIIMRNTIDEVMWAAMEDKRNVAELLTEGLLNSV